MGKTSNTTVTVHGVEMDVAFDYTPSCKGSRDKYGVPLEPDELESLDIVSVTVGGVDITEIVNAKLQDEIIAAIETIGED